MLSTIDAALPTLSKRKKPTPTGASFTLPAWRRFQTISQRQEREAALYIMGNYEV